MGCARRAAWGEWEVIKPRRLSGVMKTFFFLVWGDLHLQYLYNDREEGGWREQMPTAKERGPLMQQDPVFSGGTEMGRPSKRGVGGETVGTIPGKEKRFGRGGVAEVMEKKSSLQSASRERMIQASRGDGWTTTGQGSRAGAKTWESLT